MPRVVHFEIPAKEPDKAVKFYTDVFDWKIEKWAGPMDYWLITTGSKEQPGIDGAIAKKQGIFTKVVNTIDVPSVDEFVGKITAAGGKVVMSKMPVTGVGYMAYCEDPEGNTLGIMQMDPSAK